MIDANTQRPLILCFGEALWDSLPTGLFPGGAPLNLSYHLRQLGYRAAPITAIGKDRLGIQLLQQMKSWNLDASFVTQSDDMLTGIAAVTLDVAGNAKYDIYEDAAWDSICLNDSLLELAGSAAAIAFGTLALRGSVNQREFAKLLAHTPAAIKVYDVNLRSPHTPLETVWQLAKCADVIKLNEDELNELTPNQKALFTIEEKALLLAKKADSRCVCVTAGAKGAGLLFHGVWHWAEGRPVKTKDTVGAGDAFLAALIDGLLSQSNPQLALAKACRLGELVAASAGATPAYSLTGVNSAALSVGR